MWLQQIARESATRDACLEIMGHTTPTGLPPINDRLSLLRADYVKSRLDAIEPSLTPRTIANGVGSRENLIGTGKDDESERSTAGWNLRSLKVRAGKPV
jgi:outer membrane protein OmpA-like peptidoglycan-associated protein